MSRKRSPAILLADMMESIETIESFIQDLTFEDFAFSKKVNYAVLHCIVILAEAANALPEDFQQAHADVPWHRVKGFRNRVVHEYFDVDISVVWRIVTESLPLLKEQLKALL